MALEGKGDQLKGKIKEGVGEATDNQSLENEGKADNLGGQVREKASEAGEAVKDAFNSAAAKVQEMREK